MGIKTEGGSRIAAIANAKIASMVKSVDVGFFAKNRYPDGPYVAQVALWNEFGTANIPARPFMRNTFNSFSIKYAAFLAKILEPVDGLPTLTPNAAGKLGFYYQKQIQKTMEAGGFVEDSPSTLKAKKPKTKPLFDTGEMFRSVSFEVTEG